MLYPADLREFVEKYAHGLRMPCLSNGPIAYSETFIFEFDDGARKVLRDMCLRQLIASSKDYAMPAHFDLKAMACPFDVRLYYMRPYQPNTVHELETGNRARKPLLDWLENMTLQVDDSLIRQILGDTITESIPCGVVDL